MPLETLIKIRRGSATDWSTANPTLSLGEPGYDTTNNRIRVGDGTNTWSALDYLGSDKADSTTVTEIDGNVNDLITLSGVAENSTDLGTFSGSTIADSETVKGALQDLETYVETIAGGGAAATTVATTTDSTDASRFLTFVDDDNASATQESLKTDGGISYNPSTNTLTTTNVAATGISIGGVDVTSTAAELNVLDGIPTTLTATELGYVDGVTSSIQTQLDAKAASSTVTEIDGNVDDLITLSGVAENSTDLGTFSGSTITDSSDIKTALQELETAVENAEESSVINEIDANVDDLVTLSGVAENSTDLGTFSGSTIADSETVKGALQDLETEVETKAASSTVTEIDGNVNDLITLSGVAENSTDLGTFSGSVITDNSTVKTALQELETEVGSLSSNANLDVAGDSGTGEIIFASETLTIAGTANEIETSMATNTLTIGLPDSISVTSNVTVGGYLAGPSTFTIDPATVGDNTGTVVIAGNLTVNGTTTTINSTTLTVDDKNIEIGSVASPTDVTADGGGITLKGATDHTIIWENATDNWNSSEHWNLASGKEYQIADTSVLSATTLGSGVVTSSLTTVGTIGSGTWQGTTIGVAYGGTGLTSYTAGDLVYASGATTISKLGIGSANYFLKVNSGGTAPEWSNEIDGGTP